jgi:spore coat protein H
MLKRFLLGLTTLLITVIFAGQNLSSPRAPQNDDKNIFGLSKLHRISLTMSKAEWEVLQTSSGPIGGACCAGRDAGQDYTQPDGRIIHVGSGFRGFFPWVHADLGLEGRELKDVGLRYKGNLSFSSSSAANPFRANLKLKTDVFGGKPSWNGVETLNLHAGVLDPSLRREALGLALFRAAGVPAPDTAYAEITFNVPGLHSNASGGVYVLIENVNKQFLKKVLPPGDGLLLKPEGLRGGISSLGDTWPSYISTYRPDREATPREQQRVIEFAKLVSQTDVELFRSRIGTYLDVDEFLRYIAVNVFTGNWDSYLGGGHNFYLYLDPKDDRFRFIPWDMDLSLGSRGNARGFNMMRPADQSQALIYWLLDDPAVAQQYRRIVKELATTVFTRPALEKILVELEKVSSPQDPTLRTYLDGRVAYMESIRAEWDQ